MKKMNPLLIIGAVVVIAIIGVVAYAASQNQSMDNTTKDSDTNSSDVTNNDDVAMANTVTITDFAFESKTISVKVGTKVTWTNKDSVKHTVTSDGDSPAKLDSGLFGKDETFSFTFEKAGTYNYLCEPHPSMKGTVIVTE